MQIRAINIKNVRSFTHLTWKLNEDESAAGWHVIIGPNGAGKSTLLRAIALVLMGTRDANAARLDLKQFIRSGEAEATIKLEISADSGDVVTDQEFLPILAALGQPSEPLMPDLKLSHQFGIGTSSPAPSSSCWSQSPGWFSVGFGPFRRFSGGHPDERSIHEGYPKLARHLTLFGEDAALTEVLGWLRQLRFKELEQTSEDARLFGKIRRFINQPGFLPFDARLDAVTSERVTFIDGNGTEVPISELSDGYRSVLSMTFELIRIMLQCYPEGDIFGSDDTSVSAPGVVLIDEVDVHLHPNWQRAIGPWLCKHFPNVQFIVTTHSPFVCQQAFKGKGSIWRIGEPGSEAPLKRVEGEELTRLTLGDATLALETHAFGLEHNRSDHATELLDELAALNVKALRSGLDPVGTKRRDELRTELAPVLPGEVDPSSEAALGQG